MPGGQGSVLPAVTGLVAAVMLRAAFQIGAVDKGELAAVTAKGGWRQRIYLRVLVAAPGARRMLGETIADAAMPVWPVIAAGRMASG